MSQITQEQQYTTEFLAALQDFYSAAENLNTKWYDFGHEKAGSACQYPFQFSFDEMVKYIAEWNNNVKLAYGPEWPEGKLFEIEGEIFDLNAMLHNNSGKDQPPIDENFVYALLTMNVGDVADDIDPNYPAIKRVR